jgi:outer membrane protein OmpA-like peptidoglycan-associated protein
MTRLRTLAAAIASLALGGDLMLPATVSSFAQPLPTAEDMLSVLRSVPETVERSTEPLHQSVEEQRFIDRIRTDRTRQLAFYKQSASMLAESRPRIDLEVNFEFNSAAITSKAIPQVTALGQALTASDLKSDVFLIAGHTDARGSETFTQTLSEQRADAVKRFLTQKFDIPDDRLITVGYGKTQLKNPADPFSGDNRRIEIVNLSAAAKDLCRRGPSSAPYCLQFYQRRIIEGQ